MTEAKNDTRNPSVLVVEDNEHLRRHLSIVLEDLGVGCSMARNENEALEKIVAGKYKVIIADINLAEAGGDKRGGILLAERLHERGICVPIILISYDPWFYLPPKNTRNFLRNLCIHSVIDRNSASFYNELTELLQRVIDDNKGEIADES